MHLIGTTKDGRICLILPILRFFAPFRMAYLSAFQNLARLSLRTRVSKQDNWLRRCLPGLMACD